MNLYMKVWKDWKVYNGRASRAEYWVFLLSNITVFCALAGVETSLGNPSLHAMFEIVNYTYYIAVLAPVLAVSVRRLHDSDKSGWWLLIILIPFVGGLIFLNFMLSGSTPGQNEYGESPNQASA